MNFSIRTIISRLLSPQHELSMSWVTWHRLLAGLRRSGRRCSRESGAFLLGKRRDGRARVSTFVLYDELDPHSLDSGIVHIDGRYFGELWEQCRARELEVVADVHTHPGAADQSSSDRANPMVSTKGHIAIIVPNFAAGAVRRSSLGIFRYEGAKTWRSVPLERRKSFFHIGL